MVGSEVEIYTLAFVAWFPSRKAIFSLDRYKHTWFSSCRMFRYARSWTSFSALWIQGCVKNSWTTLQVEYKWMPWFTKATKERTCGHSSKTDSCSLWKSKYSLLNCWRVCSVRTPHKYITSWESSSPKQSSPSSFPFTAKVASPTVKL